MEPNRLTSIDVDAPLSPEEERSLYRLFWAFFSFFCLGAYGLYTWFIGP